MKRCNLRLIGGIVLGLFLATSRSLTQTVYTPYTFTTLAGTASGAGSADGTGSAASFYGPEGVAVDSVGNVCVADYFNNTIRKVTPAGVVTTLAGSAGAWGSTDGVGNAARFSSPSGVAVDTAGNVYVADKLNNTIRRVTVLGDTTTLAGLAGGPGSADGTGPDARFSSPHGVAVDKAGNVYVADEGNCTIRIVTPSGATTTLAGMAGSIGSTDGTGIEARFNFPQTVAVNDSGNVYVADTVNQTIRKVTAAGVVTTVAGIAGGLGSTDGLGTAAQFRIPYGVAVDGAGNVYVADSQNSTIRRLTPEGVVTTLAGVPTFYGSGDGTGSAARFAFPYDVAVDSAGTIYVADGMNNTIRKGVPALVFLNPGFSGGHFGFNLMGPLSNSVVVEASADLTNWLPLWTNTFAGDLHFSDSAGSATSNRHYRAYLR